MAVRKVHRYAQGGFVAYTGQSRDDLPSTDRSHFAAVHAQMLEADANVARAARSSRGLRRAVALGLLFMIFGVPMVIVLAAQLLSQ